jgi:hypothetical protein
MPSPTKGCNASGVASTPIVGSGSPTQGGRIDSEWVWIETGTMMNTRSPGCGEAASPAKRLPVRSAGRAATTGKVAVTLTVSSRTALEDDTLAADAVLDDQQVGADAEEPVQLALPQAGRSQLEQRSRLEGRRVLRPHPSEHAGHRTGGTGRCDQDEPTVANGCCVVADPTEVCCLIGGHGPERDPQRPDVALSYRMGEQRLVDLADARVGAGGLDRRHHQVDPGIVGEPVVASR